MKTRILTIGIALFMFSHLAFSQSKDTTKAPKVTFKATTDVVSSYIWRGTIASPNPNIQPTLAIDAGGLEVGVWGSTDFLGSYKEVDPYISYTLKTFKATFTDYDWNFKSPTTGNPISYFDYKNKTTGHIFEGSIAFLGTEKFPLSIAINTMIYGNDKKFSKTLGAQDSSKQNYSTYIELGYTFKQFSVLLGVTPSDGYYGDGYGKVGGFSVCNIGISSSRNIKFSKDFEMPLKASLFINPQAENIFFVLGITL